MHNASLPPRIFEASLPDLEAVRKILEESRPRGHCLRLRGLPFSATAPDVAAFLEGVRLAEGPESMVFTFTADGRPTGEAYVEVVDEAAVVAAMQKHKELMGTRYIEVFASTKHDLLQAAQQAQFQQSQAALRRRFASLNVVPVAAVGVAGAAAAPLMLGTGIGAVLQQQPGMVGPASPYVQPSVSMSSTADVESLTQSFEGA